MTTQQAYIDGFVKRASECGYSESEAVELLKNSGLNLKAITSAIPPVKALKDTVMKAAPIQKLKDTVTKAAPIQRLTM
jgi:hypothetical protein